MRSFRWFALVLFALAAPIDAQVPAALSPAPGSALPSRLDDSTFWKLASDISEPGGFFRITDDFTSNEREVGELSTIPLALPDRGVSARGKSGTDPRQRRRASLHTVGAI